MMVHQMSIFELQEEQAIPFFDLLEEILQVKVYAYREVFTWGHGPCNIYKNGCTDYSVLCEDESGAYVEAIGLDRDMNLLIRNQRRYDIDKWFFTGNKTHKIKPHTFRSAELYERFVTNGKVS